MKATQDVTGSIRLLVDGDDVASAKGAFGLPPGIGTVPQKVLELSASAFQQSLKAVLSSVADALDGLDLSSRDYALADVKFCIAFDAGGEVSIVSLAKASLSGKTGIEVTLKRRVN
jgi:hypothetical protein